MRNYFNMPFKNSGYLNQPNFGARAIRFLEIAFARITSDLFFHYRKSSKRQNKNVEMVLQINGTISKHRLLS